MEAIVLVTVVRLCCLTFNSSRWLQWDSLTWTPVVTYSRANSSIERNNISRRHPRTDCFTRDFVFDPSRYTVNACNLCNCQEKLAVIQFPVFKIAQRSLTKDKRKFLLSMYARRVRSRTIVQKPFCMSAPFDTSQVLWLCDGGNPRKKLKQFCSHGQISKGKFVTRSLTKQFYVQSKTTTTSS